ncbi:MAG TPA: heavy metal-associated domain-containing protein [Bacteroidales bacterium]|nr:heavy metal-associated domain-containing protein [Bacteroidales bacterium]
MKAKNLIFSLMAIFIVLASTAGFSQNSKSKNSEIKITTSAQCGMCKTRIENGLAYEPGIKNVSLDLETKVVTVSYNPKKTNPDKIRTIINNLGYDADDTKANKEAYDKLPPCCKKPEPGTKIIHQN